MSDPGSEKSSANSQNELNPFNTNGHGMGDEHVPRIPKRAKSGDLDSNSNHTEEQKEAQDFVCDISGVDSGSAENAHRLRLKSDIESELGSNLTPPQFAQSVASSAFSNPLASNKTSSSGKSKTSSQASKSLKRAFGAYSFKEATKKA